MTEIGRLVGRFVFGLAPWAVAGCVASPIPTRIEELHSQARRIARELDSLLQPGDLIFRLGHLDMGKHGDLGEFMSSATDSPFSHVAMVWRRLAGEWVVAGIDVHGLERLFLTDFLTEGENVVVKRLRPELALRETPEGESTLARVLLELESFIKADPLSDDQYEEGTDRLYCAELVDVAFRRAGCPLAERTPIRDLPGLPWYAWYLSWRLDVDLDTPIAVPGNDSYGLVSSPALIEVASFLRDAND